MTKIAFHFLPAVLQLLLALIILYVNTLLFPPEGKIVDITILNSITIAQVPLLVSQLILIFVMFSLNTLYILAFTSLRILSGKSRYPLFFLFFPLMFTETFLFNHNTICAILLAISFVLTFRSDSFENKSHGGFLNTLCILIAALFQPYAIIVLPIYLILSLFINQYFSEIIVSALYTTVVCIMTLVSLLYIFDLHLIEISFPVANFSNIDVKSSVGIFIFIIPLIIALRRYFSVSNKIKTDQKRLFQIALLGIVVALIVFVVDIFPSPFVFWASSVYYSNALYFYFIETSYEKKRIGLVFWIFMFLTIIIGSFFQNWDILHIYTQNLWKYLLSMDIMGYLSRLF